jgi:hypothetical protein
MVNGKRDVRSGKGGRNGKVEGEGRGGMVGQFFA